MNETGRKKVKKMPFDQRFGNELCHCTGYLVCFGDTNCDADWWYEYERQDGTMEYGR